MWKEVEHVILAPEKVIDEIVDVFLSFFSFSQEVFHLRRKEKTNKRHAEKKKWKEESRNLWLTEGNLGAERYPWVVSGSSFLYSSSSLQELLSLLFF